MMTTKVKSTSFGRHALAKDYYVMGIIGEGAFGLVKVALHRVTEIMVAIKILERSPSRENLISNEIQLLKSLHHPHIIQLLQVIQSRHKTYLVMEHAARGSLKRRVTKNGHLKEKEARILFRELTLAIKYIHSQNIAHRDIKPENILIDWQGHVKLSDFGLAQRLVSGEKVRGLWGTRQYCAPEVFGHKQYDGLPPDIWSLGVVLYFLVTEHLPFRETEYYTLEEHIILRNCWIPPHLSPELQDLLNHLMTVDPTKRPSIEEVIAHPWLCHDEETLSPLEEIPREPEPNIAFEMFLMGYKIQRLKEALREQKYTSTMATYLLLKMKSTWRRQYQHSGGLGGTMDPAKAPYFPLPVRRGASVTFSSTITFSALPELTNDDTKGRRMWHSLTPTLNYRLRKITSKEDEHLLYIKKLIGGDSQSSMESRSSPSSGTSAAATASSTSSSIPTSLSVSLLSSTLTFSGHPCAETSSLEQKIDVSTESSETRDTGASTSFQESTSKKPFPSEEAKVQGTGNISLQERSQSSGKKSLQEHLQGQCQGVPRVPQRQQSWKGLKKRICQALPNLCCCLPVDEANTEQDQNHGSQ